MASTFSFASVPVKSSRPKLFHHRGSVNLRRCCSSKVLSMVHFQDEDITSSNPLSENYVVSRRPTVDFPPSVGDDYHFIPSPSSDLKPDTRSDHYKIEELKGEVKSILGSADADPCQQLVFIDTIQRLGIEYHFDYEIGKALQQIYTNTAHEDGDVNIVGLRFRLLRQAGYLVSPGVFSKFKDERGEFFASLRHDLQGLLSLYEAAYLGCKGEDILDQAISFTTHHLKCLASQENLGIKSRVRRALDLPLRKRIPRVEATHYMSMYENLKGSEKDVLLQLAKLDFNALQLLHQAELKQLTRWWKESNVLSSLPFQARDRLVEGFAMMASLMPEAKYSTGRIFSTKIFALFTLIDDIFDVYGTIPELQKITDVVISRWGVKDAEELPEFAKVIVSEMYNIFNEIAKDMVMRGLDYTEAYFQDETQLYFRRVLDEAKLFHSKRVPTLEEWFQISETTIGIRYMVISMVLAHWDLATKEAMDWSISEASRIINSSSRCGRILDDISTFKMEQERGNIASSITCYMKEHGVQEQEAIENLKKMVEEEWKVMNKECLNPTIIPLRLLMIPVNLMRMGQNLFMYYHDGYTIPKGYVKEMIASLLVNPVSN